MKKKLRFLSVFVAAFLLCLVLSGCSPSRELNKAKKGLSLYKISGTLNEDFEFLGKESVDFVNAYQTELNSVCFNLYPRAFREDATIRPWTSINEAKCFPSGVNYGDLEVLSVKAGGKDAEFKLVGLDQNALEVSLKSPLDIDERVNIEIEFKTSLAECTHRLGHFEGSVNLCNFYPILAVYEKGEFNITPYYSTGDPFYSMVANYEVDFSYPDKYLLSSSGTMLSETSDGGYKKVSLKADAVRDFSIALTAEASRAEKTVGETKITYTGYEGDEDIDEMLEVSAEALEFFNRSFGTYPYEKLDVVKAPFVHGGMEYPCMVLISDSASGSLETKRIIVHEIAHQWWYALVGNNEIDEAWLDEGLSEYSSILFFESHPEYGMGYEKLVSESFAGYVLYADIVSTLMGRVNTSMMLSVNDYVSEYEYSYMVYVRGVLMLDQVRQLVGEENMMKGFKSYFKKFKFKIAKTDDFISTFSKATGRDIEGLLDSWLSGSAVVGVI